MMSLDNESCALFKKHVNDIVMNIPKTERQLWTISPSSLHSPIFPPLKTQVLLASVMLGVSLCGGACSES